MDYLLFVDLDCTALAYDGVKLLGTDRSLLSHAGKYNFITSSMLQIRRDTPRRVGKKAQLGFGTFVSCNPDIERGDHWQKAFKQSLDTPPEFFNDARRMCLTSYGGLHSMEEMVACLTEHSGSYSETKLPRGKGVAPALLQRFLNVCHRRARSQGKALIAHDITRLYQQFPDTFPIVYVGEKLKIKTEAWWREWAVI